MMDPQVSAGPLRLPVDKEAARRSVLAALWQATWEASQHVSYEDIKDFVDGTLVEIESDAD